MNGGNGSKKGLKIKIEEMKEVVRKKEEKLLYKLAICSV